MLDREELKDLASYRDDENLIISFYYPWKKGNQPRKAISSG